MINTQNIVIHDLSHLHTLLRQNKRRGWELEMVELTRSENAIFESAIKTYHGACGCAHGTAAMLVCAISYPLFLYLNDLHKSEQIYWEIFLGLVLIIGSLGLGKYFGILIARRKLKQCLIELRRKIDAPRPEIAPPAGELVEIAI